MGKIIVVEDNLVFSGYVCGMLESKGYRTAGASDCKGARKLFANIGEDDWCFRICACPTVTVSPCWKN